MTRPLHRLWLGTNPMPLDYKAFGEMWEAMNPEWGVRTWYGPAYPLINQAVYDDIGRLRDEGRFRVLDPIAVATQRADVMSYELLLAYGGVYVNCDIEPVRPLSALEERVGDKAWVCYEDDTYVVNCAMGGPPAHPFFKAVIDALPERYWANRRGEMNQTTGPRLLTDVYNSWKGEEVVALSRFTFNPLHWSEIPLGGDATGLVKELHPDTIGIHHWGSRKSGRSNYVESPA